MSATAHVHAAAPRLERPRRGRAIAGVSAGLARHLNIDPTLVRIGFVLLAAFGGAGFLAYFAGVLLIPEEGAQRPMIRSVTGRRIAMVGGIALLVVGSAAAFDALIGDGVGHVVGWSVVLFAVGAWLVMRPFDGVGAEGDTAAVTAETATAAPSDRRRRGRSTRVVGGAMLLGAGAAMIIAAAGIDLGGQQIAGVAVIAAGAALVTGSFFGASPWLAVPPLALAACVGALAASGVSLRGPIGDRTFHPATATELPGTYRVAIGQARLDLRDIALPAGTTTVRLRVGIGEARVTVPRNVTVRVIGHAGAGDVLIAGGRSDGTDVDRTQTFAGPEGAPVLVLDARVGLGAVHVDRGAAR